MKLHRKMPLPHMGGHKTWMPLLRHSANTSEQAKSVASEFAVWRGLAQLLDEHLAHMSHLHVDLFLADVKIRGKAQCIGPAMDDVHATRAQNHSRSIHCCNWDPGFE